MSYLGKRGVLCAENSYHFCSAVLMNMSNITFGVPRLSTFVFKKSPEKKIFTIISIRCWEVNGFWLDYCWPSVADGGPTLFRNWANVSCYLGSGHLGHKALVHRYGSQSKHGTITQLCFNVGSAPNTIKPAMGCDADQTLNRCSRFSVPPVQHTGGYVETSFSIPGYVQRTPRYAETRKSPLPSYLP